MFAIFKEDRVTQSVYRPTRIGRARRPMTKAELSLAASGCSGTEVLPRVSSVSTETLVDGGTPSFSVAICVAPKGKHAPHGGRRQIGYRSRGEA